VYCNHICLYISLTSETPTLMRTSVRNNSVESELGKTNHTINCVGYQQYIAW
jgi:hypothetical protein